MIGDSFCTDRSGGWDIYAAMELPAKHFSPNPKGKKKFPSGLVGFASKLPYRGQHNELYPIAQAKHKGAKNFSASCPHPPIHE